jgi:hypothetical protein
VSLYNIIPYTHRKGIAMSKAIIVVDFAYKGPKRRGRGTGHQGLRSTLKYLQFRDNRTEHLEQDDRHERWHDFDMGVHYREIFENADLLQSPYVLTWTWVISPAPDLMRLVPAEKRAAFVGDLTERVVEDYCIDRGFDIPEYSYVTHDRLTTPKADDDEPLHQLHTYVILPGTASTFFERVPFYNNTERGHDKLFREVATHHFAEMLDEVVGPEWQLHRDDITQDPQSPDFDDLDLQFDL